MKKVFRSGLESALYDKLNKEFKYEPYKLPYIIRKKYLPDFVHEEKKILVEAKGYFRVGDTQKYTSIRDSVGDWELVFVLSDPNKKIRKGSKMTMGQWCDKEGLAHFTVKTSNELLKYIRNKNVTNT
jgi:hypothetical protein